MPELTARTVWRRRAIYLAVLIGAAGLVWWALLPQPVPVDSAEITRGPMQVTVNEEGITEIREIYTVSAPVGGRVLRTPRKAGDRVVENETLLATIEPGSPEFLDERSRREAEAMVEAARAAVQLYEARVSQAEAELEFAKSDLARAERLAERGVASERSLDQARLDVRTRQAALASARAELQVKRQELDSARARLIQPGSQTAQHAPSCCVSVRAPITGQVLSVMVESEQVVSAGTALMELGDPADIELVVDLLSSDAVRVEEGAPAYVERWGGDGVLNARVRRIEPAGFEEVSALGIEEQRVRVRLDLEEPADRLGRLGHAYRVYVRIVMWQDDDVLRVPISALFRRGEEWAVFVHEGGRAELRTVRIGQRNSERAVVSGGLEAGERVILHPSDRIADGTTVIERTALD